MGGQGICGRFGLVSFSAQMDGYIYIYIDRVCVCVLCQLRSDRSGFPGLSGSQSEFWGLGSVGFVGFGVT